jgi:hypothetical protein
MSGRGVRIRNDLLLVVPSALVAVVFALFSGGAPLVVCWMGVGPAPEPQTSECVSSKIAQLSPYERFMFDHTLLGVVLLAVFAFITLLALALVVRRLLPALGFGR